MSLDQKKIPQYDDSTWGLSFWAFLISQPLRPTSCPQHFLVIVLSELDPLSVCVNAGVSPGPLALGRDALDWLPKHSQINTYPKG